MARARNIKPGFFKNEDLAELPADVRLLFIGLWTLADREGRMEDRPRRIKAELFPFDQSDVDSMLNQLQSKKFVVRYEVSGARFIQVTNFVKHQDPHYKEKASEIAPPPGESNLIEATNVSREQRARIMDRDGYRCRSCGAEEYLSIDHVVPVSRGGNSDDSNLQVLCLKCNKAKGNKLSGEENGTRKSKHQNTSIRTRIDVGSNSNQIRPKDPGSVPLIPDSLNPSSLNPDSKDSGANAPVASPPAEALPGCPFDEIIDAYHSALPTCPQVLIRNKSRDGLMRSRWREVFASGKAKDRGDGIELFREFFGHVAESKFLTGRAEARNGTPPFVADLEWLMRPTNFAKVVEGRYHRG